MELALSSLFAAAVSFLFLGCMFWPLEKAFPAKKQKLIREEWGTDLLFFAGQYLLWGAVILFALSHCSATLGSFVPQAFILAVRAQPFWLQALEVILLGDFCIYWMHRLQHNVPLLWRFHAIHHTPEHLDWLAAHREHPVDGLITQLTINLPAFVLGFPIGTLSALIAFRGIWGIYIHSNVRLPLGPLKWIIGAPELHHWHHSKERMSCNYANLSPLMDIIFGTYKCPDHEPPELGVKEEFPRTYLGQLVYPFTSPEMPGRPKEE